MKRYVLTPSATKDVNDVWDYVANDSIEAADRVLIAFKNPALVIGAKSWPTNDTVSYWCIQT